MQNILVTGGAGRLGRPLVRYLSEIGYRVRRMSRRSSPGVDWPGAEWKQADLATGAGLEEAVQGMDVGAIPPAMGPGRSRLKARAACWTLPAGLMSRM
jgi:uncharacterized protein YbjT (DUF2867 family)